MQGNSPPPAPDPVATAQAQTQSNRETAIANAHLNRVNQYTPQGSRTYRVTGTNADGTPIYEQTDAYSQGEQTVYDRNLQSRQNVGQIGVDATARLGSMLNSNFDVNQETEDRLNALGSARLDPRFQREQATMEQSLANKGISVGSAAYQRAMDQFGQTKNDAYNQLALTGRGQAMNESLLQRNQPINEITALMSGSQVSSPSYGAVPNATQANTDVAGITNASYQNQMAAYNAEQAQNNAMMGGIFGLGGAAMRFLPFSDRRLKSDIVLVGEGTGERGLNEYEFNYIFGGPRQRGYMADEVMSVAPWAVRRQGNFYAVNYEAI